MAKRKALGRGLDALLAGASGKSPAPPDGDLRTVPVDLIERGRLQPRARIEPESLAELADSIRARGIVQPVVVRPIGAGNRFELIAGERRWRASQMAGLDAIPALVKSDLTDDAVLAIALVENLQREDLNPIDEARAFRRLTDEFGLTHQAVAGAVGRSRAAVSNALRLLELEPAVLALVEGEELEMGHARALLALAGRRQVEAARTVVEKGLSVRDAEALARRLAGPAAPRRPRKARSDPDVRRLEDSLSERLGARVQIKHRATGGGRVEIRYGSVEELDGILEKIRP